VPADLRTLLAQEALGLRLLSREDELPAGALSRPIPWVHSSDLPDPTPFLTPGVVLLTTGTQFGSGARVSRASARAYVSRLAAGGVGGVGFGTEVIRDGTPGPLAAACAEHGLPLFEVPYRTPFIAVAQASTAAATAEAAAIKAMGEQLRAAAAEAARAAEASQQRFLAELTRANEVQHAKLLAAIQAHLAQVRLAAKQSSRCLPRAAMLTRPA